MIALLVVLPLYTGGSYWQLGDTKYGLFRNVSLICLGIWLVVSLISRAIRLVKTPPSGGFALRRWDITGKWSTVDCMVGAYGLAVIISCLHSPYGMSAWSGYRDWYMGALSQLLFVGIYFFIANQYSYSAHPLYLGEGALLIVTLIGLQNRLGVDPLGLYTPFTLGDWEYSHMLSTIGNINWLCGYLGLMLTFTLAGYLQSSRLIKEVLLYGISVLTLLLLLIQGSDSGLLMIGVCFGICLLGGIRHGAYFRKGLLLGIGLLLLMPIMGRLILHLKMQAAMPSDGNVLQVIIWPGWWLAAGVLLLIYLLLRAVPEAVSRRLIRVLLVMGGATVVVGAVYLLSGMTFDSRWGSGRGGLWMLAWKGFWEADIPQKLLGAGPDCFGEYIYATQPVSTTLYTVGRWQNSLYANAHNEWLNQLVNLGIVGTAAYAGIFISALRRYRGMLLGVLALSMYLVNSLISFQQVMNAPYLFLILGLCENRLRQQRDS